MNKGKVIHLSTNSPNLDSSYSEEINDARKSVYKDFSKHIVIAVLFVVATTLILAGTPVNLAANKPMGITGIVDKIHSDYSLPPGEAFTILAVLAAVVLALSLTPPSEVSGRVNFGKAVANYEIRKLLLNLCGFMSVIIMIFVVLFWASAGDVFRGQPINSGIAVFMALVVLILTIVRVRREDLEIASLTRSIERVNYNLEKLIRYWDVHWKNSALHQTKTPTSPGRRATVYFLKATLLPCAVWCLNVLTFFIALVFSGYRHNLLVYVHQSLGTITIITLAAFILPLLGLAIVSVCIRNFRRDFEFIIVHVPLILLALPAISLPILFFHYMITNPPFILLNNLNALITVVMLVCISPALFISRRSFEKHYAWPLKVVQNAQWAVAEYFETERRKSLEKWIASMVNEIPKKEGYVPTPNLTGSADSSDSSSAGEHHEGVNRVNLISPTVRRFAPIAVMGTVTLAAATWATLSHRKIKNK